MEFFAYIKNNLDSEYIQSNINIKNLPGHCASIDNVMSTLR